MDETVDKPIDDDQRQLRQSADQDFMRSLDQLENLLEENLSAENLLEENLIVEEAHRFGGSILDAIPLANRLGDRLNDPLSGWSRAESKVEDVPLEPEP